MPHKRKAVATIPRYCWPAPSRNQVTVKDKQLFDDESAKGELSVYSFNTTVAMAAVQQRILNWLYSVLTSEYQDVGRTYNDIAQTLSQYSSLTPRTEVFTYEHGASALLLLLSGTLPVTFRGTTYRFPVSVWIPHAYPRESPLVYVTPTEGMMIRAGQHVDPQGKVYHPYLVGWAEFWDKSNVLDFLAILRDVFAKEPPVISRQQRNAASSPRQPSLPPPVPPLPPDIARSSPLTTSSQGGPPQPPPPPPKQFGSLTQNTPERRNSGPPPPPLPPNVRSPSQNHQQGLYETQRQSTRQSILRYETPPALPLQQQSLPIPPYGQRNVLPQAQQNRPQSQTFSPTGQYAQGPSPGQVPTPSQYPPPSYGGPPNQYQHYQQQPPPQKKPPPPPDLIDEPLTLPDPASHIPLPPPPIPPNPEKDLILHTLAQSLYHQRQQTLSRTLSSLPSLKSQHNAMLTSWTALTTEIAQLESLTALLSSNTAILHSALQTSDSVISSSANRAPPGVDEILVAPTVVGNQLYEVVNEERALADAVFVLGRAVERGRVNPAVFAKITRGLAREWFLKKALGRKIARGMGLESVGRGGGYGR